MQDLAIYERAKQAIAEYKTVDEVKDFRDKALAVEAYAKQANDMELEWDAARARVRAERKCGELLAQLEKARGGDRKSTSAPVEIDSEYKQACDRASISKDQASNYQKLAAVPEEEFEQAVELPGTKPNTTHILNKLKPQPEPKRMDQDALWFWGTLRDMRQRGIFDRSIEELVGEWTPAMAEDTASIIATVKTWVDDYAKNNT